MKRFSVISRFFRGAVAAAILAASTNSPASAYTAYDLYGTWTIGGTYAGEWLNGFWVSPAPSACSYGIIYVDVASDGGKSMMSSIIAANIARVPIYYMGFTTDGGSGCWLKLIQFGVPPS